ncbi:uroporphyrinogen decarboxylase [Spirochaetota bacterium]|nr:uroporphyrinogen decarboxylase [Spirochaetota bacterium]
MKDVSQSLLLRTLRKEPTPRPPVWFMRQAGRSLSSYRALKNKYDFQTLLNTPDLAAEITLLPITDLGVDAAIIFSDILVIIEALGFTIGFGASHRPVSASQSQKYPLHSPSSSSKQAVSQKLTPYIDNPLKTNPLPPTKYPYRSDCKKLENLSAAIKLVKQNRPEIPLIGFCGGPLTIFLYLFAGSGGSFEETLVFIENNPEFFSDWIAYLTDCSIEYAELQLRSGVDVFQIFESWAGLLSSAAYEKYVMGHVVRLAQHIRKKAPVIYFPRLFKAAYPSIPTQEFDAISIDDSLTLTTASKIFNKPDNPANNIVLQGNIHPQVPLYLSHDQLTEYLTDYLRFFKTYPHWIVNLSHGVLPETQEKALQIICQTVKNLTH